MYTLIIMAFMYGSGKAVAIHDVKFTSLAQCQDAARAVQSFQDTDLNEVVRTVCVKTE
jgi:hypothetical protein